jgi:hypothetical protein
LKDQFAAGYDLFISNPGLVKRFAVSSRALNVKFLRAVAFGDNGERLAIAYGDGATVELRSAGPTNAYR